MLVPFQQIFYVAMGHNHSSARREEHVVLGRVDNAGEFAYGVQWPYNFTD